VGELSPALSSSTDEPTCKDSGSNESDYRDSHTDTNLNSRTAIIIILG
jgi:hypothetical protein